MPTKNASNARPVARKTLKRRISNRERKKGSGLINSLHEWGEDYYGAEDYYEKPVNSNMSKTHSYNDYRKKADKQ